MAEMSKYCKAYYVKDLAQFSGWQPKLDDLRPEEDEKDPDKKTERTALKDDDIVYVHDSYIVTDGTIYPDEHVLFDKVSDEWKEFLEKTLDPPFEIPQYEEIEIKVEETTEGAGAN